MNSFKVSIILPVYNVEKYLSVCLDSLLAQTLEDIEIVAVNDGSTDGSLQILQAYQALHPDKLFIYSTDNHGVSRARNYGFAHSHGEYIWFVDSDDYVEADACRLLYEKASKDGNDLVLFRFNSVYPDTNEKKPSPCVHYNQNFNIASKPYELANIVLYPWNKLIRRTLFEGIEFPEGIRFEDVPVSFQLYARARSIGVINLCFYNYIRNIGFSEALTRTTFDICKAYNHVINFMRESGFYQQYYNEIAYVAVRHFLFRIKKLLTNYDTGKKELKIQFTETLYHYLDHTFPNWQDNPYVRYTMPAPVANMFYFYSDKQQVLNFINNCDSLSSQQQKNWIKDYRASFEKDSAYHPAGMIQLEKTAAQFYHFAYTGSLAPDPEQIFLESGRGNEIPAWTLGLLAHLIRHFSEYHIVFSLAREKHPLLLALLNRYLPDNKALPKNITLISPGTEEYGKALALSGYLITDSPLPYYFRKEKGQFVLLYCGHGLYPETVLNTPASTADTGLWQHTMFLADAIYFNSVQNRNIYMSECMTDRICPTPYIIGNSGDAPVVPEQSNTEKIRRSLQLDGVQTILYAPRLPGSYLTDAAQTYRNFMAALYIMDQELEDHQILYLHLDGEKRPDFSDFTHIREMPPDFDVSDFASACDYFISDYHSALSAKYHSGTRVLRFLCGNFGKQNVRQRDFLGNERITDEFFPCSPAFDNVPQLIHFINLLDQEDPESTHQYELQSTAKKTPSIVMSDPTTASEASQRYQITDIVDFLLNGRPLPYYREDASSAEENFAKTPTSHRTRVLFFTGRKLSHNLIRDFNALAAQEPDKEFWLAYNDFRNTDSQKYLAQLAPECSCLPLKPDPDKGKRWKLASVLTSRMGLYSLYPLSHILELGKAECKRCLGNAEFDQVVITSTDSIKTVATLLAAAPSASYMFDTFNPERYQTSRPYRHQIAFLCRLLKDTGNTKLPSELTGLKFAQSSGTDKDKGTL